MLKDLSARLEKQIIQMALLEFQKSQGCTYERFVALAQDCTLCVGMAIPVDPDQTAPARAV